MRFLRRFSAQDLLYIAILAALGLAIKPIVTPLIHLISAPLMIPGGSLAGGFYMMWLVLAIALVNKPGTAILVGLTQAIVMISWVILAAMAPSPYQLHHAGHSGRVCRLFFRDKSTLAAHVVLCTVANCTGAIIVTVLVMRLAAIPLIMSLVAAVISGIIGGIMSHYVFKRLKAYRVI